MNATDLNYTNIVSANITFIEWVDSYKRPATAIDLGIHHYDAPSINIGSDAPSVGFGIIKHNHTRVGEFHIRDGSVTTIYYSHTRKFIDKDILTLELIYPTAYTAELKIYANNLDNPLPTNDLVEFTDYFIPYLDIKNYDLRYKLNAILHYLNIRPNAITPVSPLLDDQSNVIHEINRRLTGKYNLPYIDAKVFNTTNELTSYTNANLPSIGELVINLSNNRVRGYAMDGWVDITGTIGDILEVNRIIRDTNDNRYFSIKNKSTLELVNITEHTLKIG